MLTVYVQFPPPPPNKQPQPKRVGVFYWLVLTESTGMIEPHDSDKAIILLNYRPTGRLNFL